MAVVKHGESDVAYLKGEFVFVFLGGGREQHHCGSPLNGHSSDVQTALNHSSCCSQSAGNGG